MDLSLKNIILADGVIRTDTTDPVILALDMYFSGIPVCVSSIHRTSTMQLDTIEYYAKKVGILNQGDNLDFTEVVEYNGLQVPRWQLIWSLTRGKGIIIQPPIAAKILTDVFIDDGNGGKLNIIGRKEQPSEHVGNLLSPKGDTCFDVGGRNPKTGIIDLTEHYQIIQKAAPHIGINFVLIEHGNDCVHCSTLKR
jgi:hypothetical protein